MTEGQLIPGPPPPHVCHPPPVRTFESQEPLRSNGGFPAFPLFNTLTEGTTYVCPCEKGWVVRYAPARTDGRTYMVGGPVWGRESNPERRRRLRIPMWKVWR